MAVELAIPDSPAASAKGTVSPSDIPITMSLTASEPVKCFSMCGVCGILLSIFNCTLASLQRTALMASEFTQGSQKADHVVSAQHAQNLVTIHDGQLVDA